MIKNKKILAIIPARKNSERLKNKNLKKFKGKPLIFWTLKAAKKSKYIDKVVVSSNSQKALNVSKQYKDFFLSKRPERFCTKKSELIDTVLYEIKKFKDYDIVILLQPTSPLRTSLDIDKSLNMMIKKFKKSSVSFVSLKCCEPHNFYLIKNKNKIKRVSKVKNYSTNRQSYAKFYYPSGDLYISYIDRIIKKKNFIDRKTLPFLIKDKNSSDIDDIFDFKTAEYKASFVNKNFKCN
tara:strand:- start:305 stop:1015 length:711 start_codon:yes stop_codon:yes gene_type:complete